MNGNYIIALKKKCMHFISSKDIIREKNGDLPGKKKLCHRSRIFYPGCEGGGTPGIMYDETLRGRNYAMDIVCFGHDGRDMNTPAMIEGLHNVLAMTTWSRGGRNMSPKRLSFSGLTSQNGLHRSTKF